MRMGGDPVKAICGEEDREAHINIAYRARTSTVPNYRISKHQRTVRKPSQPS